MQANSEQFATQNLADVIVVGGGGSGLAAAIEAASLGRSVILVEKNTTLGGSTIRSIGSISATGTKQQLSKGIFDSPQDHFDDLGILNEAEQKRWMGYPNADNLELRRILVEHAGETLCWLESLGVRFFGPTPEHPHRRQRMHNVLPNSRAYGYWLERRARALRVEIHTARRATQLLRSGERIYGVECSTDSGKREHYIARGGVVLACGDWSSGEEMKRRYARPELVLMKSACNPANTGDLHLEAIDTLGARILNAHMAVARIRFVAPPLDGFVHKLPPWRALTRFMQLALDHMPAWLLRPFIMSFLTTVLEAQPSLYEHGAILVNKLGERFCDELNHPEFKLVEQPQQHAYLLFDARLASKYSQFPHFVSTAPGVAYAYIADYRRSRRDLFHEAPTLEGLARSIGADPQTLAFTVHERNAQLATNSTLGTLSIAVAPFYALGPVSCYVRGTEGGLAVDERFRLLGSNGAPLEGVFGAGLFGQGGTLLEGHGHHLGWAFTSGRLAGRNAAHLATSPTVTE